MKQIRLRSAISFLFIFFQAIAPVANAEEPLPPIDARRFEVTPVQKSSSGKIYLFESISVTPKTGNLVLIYDHEKPAMAFRVLKNDPQKKTFVGKRVRRYDQTSELELKSHYSTLEKIADALPPPPTEDVESVVVPAHPATPIPAAAPLDSVVESNTTPAPTVEPTPEPTPLPPPEEVDADLDSNSSQALDKMEEEFPEQDEDDEIIEVDETPRLEPWNNILSVTAGYWANASNFAGSSVLSNGFGVSYAHVLFHDVFINRKSPQDSIALELGAIHYRIINKDGSNDIYSLLPFYATLLYQLHTSATFSFNLYGGLQYNYMYSATNAGRSTDSLQGLQPDFGIGAFYNLGPQWYLRFDAGWDRITGGLSIKW